MYYLTEEDYATAEKNGINRKIAYQRYYLQGWKVEKTITHPVKKIRRLYPKYQRTCERNGVSVSTFYKRLREGMEPEAAATLPTIARGTYPRNSKITAEEYTIAESNGIQQRTVQARVYAYKWPVHLAITVPTGQRVKRMNEG
jgi:hypothetical protein